MKFVSGAEMDLEFMKRCEECQKMKADREYPPTICEECHEV
jgi:rRNA maturation endonuclease Nob1